MQSKKGLKASETKIWCDNFLKRKEKAATSEVLKCRFEVDISRLNKSIKSLGICDILWHSVTLYGSVSWNVCARSWHMTWPAACLWPLTSQGRQTWMKHESFGEAESESPTADSTSYSSYFGYNTYWQNLTKCAKVIARYDNMTMVEYYIPVYIKISWKNNMIHIVDGNAISWRRAPRCLCISGIRWALWWNP